ALTIRPIPIGDLVGVILACRRGIHGGDVSAFVGKGKLAWSDPFKVDRSNLQKLIDRVNGLAATAGTICLAGGSKTSSRHAISSIVRTAQTSGQDLERCQDCLRSEGAGDRLHPDRLFGGRRLPAVAEVGEPSAA